MDLHPPRRPGRLRIIAFRVVVVAFLGLGLAGFNVVLLFPLISWLPESTWIDTIGYPADDIHHLVHGAAIGLWYAALMLCLAVQLRRPQRWVAPLWVIAFIMVSQIAYDLAIGDIGDPIWFLAYALFVLAVLLHPRRTAPLGAVDRPALALGVIAAVPLVWYGWNRLQLQFGPADPSGHVELNHFFAVAGLAGLIIVSALLGSTDLPGRRLVAWIAGVAPALFGVASLAHPDLASAWPVPWAVAAIAWGAGYVTVVEWGRRRTREVADAAPPTPLGQA
jgi:hypothetical protein